MARLTRRAGLDPDGLRSGRYDVPQAHGLPRGRRVLVLGGEGVHALRRARRGLRAARRAPHHETLRRLQPRYSRHLGMAVHWCLKNANGPNSATMTFRESMDMCIPSGVKGTAASGLFVKNE